MSYAKQAELEITNIHALRTCPYNPAHKVGATKFPTHLTRCRELYPELAAKMEICFYNRTHHVLSTEMSQHMTMCPEYLDFAAKNLTTTDIITQKQPKHDDGEGNNLTKMKEEGGAQETRIYPTLHTKKKSKGAPTPK